MLTDSLHGVVLGYDPGGNGKHGVARLQVEQGRVVDFDSATEATCRTAIAYLSQREALGLGVDTLTAWSDGPSGLRWADRYLRDRYRKVKAAQGGLGSVIAPNAIRGSMCLSGMTAILALRRRHPDFPVTETHPKVLYTELAGPERPYDWDGRSSEMKKELLDWLGLADVPDPGEIESEDAWDALVSAYAMLQGLTGAWTRDLHSVAASEENWQLVEPAGRTSYYWPS